MDQVIYIPNEIILHILSFSSYEDKALRMNLVCTFWNNVLDDTNHWKGNCLQLMHESNLDTMLKIVEKRLQNTLGQNISKLSILKRIYFDCRHNALEFNTTNCTKYSGFRMSDLPSEGSSGPLQFIQCISDAGGGTVFRYELPTKKRVRRWHMDRNVQTFTPIPLHLYRCVPLFYLEMTILTHSDACAIGLAVDNYDMGLQPGWRYGSCGYHADDGGVYVQEGHTHKYFEPYHIGDTVGIGVLAKDRTVFATKNGRFLGVMCIADMDMHVTLGMWEQMEVRVNLGKESFVFDLTTLFEEPLFTTIETAKADVPHVKSRRYMPRPLPPNFVSI